MYFLKSCGCGCGYHQNRVDKSVDKMTKIRKNICFDHDVVALINNIKKESQKARIDRKGLSNSDIVNHAIRKTYGNTLESKRQELKEAAAKFHALKKEVDDLEELSKEQ